jgi:hypothetical protein
MKKTFGCAAIAALLSSSVLAQEVTAPASSAPAPAVAPASSELTLPAGTEILLSTSSEINSTDNHAGDTFPLTVVSDVRVGDQVVIPHGTRAVGEIIWRTGRGAFGKSGKMNIALRYVDLGGQRIPVTGTFRQEGNGATLATVAGIIAVGIFAGFITGHRATIPAGRELLSRTAAPVPFAMPGAQLASSYDAAAVMSAAQAQAVVAEAQQRRGH